MSSEPSVEWFVYFPLLKEVVGPFDTLAAAEDEAGPCGRVLRAEKRRRAKPEQAA